VSFSNPLALVALAVVPALAAAYVWRERRRERDAAAWARPALLPNLVDRAPGIRRHLPFAVLGVALTALIVGVARPHATVSVRREDATVLLAIDTSRSMGATDVEPTRLRAAQTAADDFVDQVPKKFRVGVVAFGTHATVAAAPTTDRDYVKSAIAALHTGEGTAIGDAVALAANLAARDRKANGGVTPTAVLLLSDGSRDGGRFSPQQAAARARAQHVPVSTVALGTPNGVVRHALPGGLTEIIQVPPSPQTLKQIAATTGGRFYSAVDLASLKSVYEHLRSQLGHKHESRELTDLFAAGGGALMLLGGALSALWFRRVP
jgi:Ca-activated chloride channel homolog